MTRNALLATIVTLMSVPALAGPGGHHREPDFDRLAAKLELEQTQIEPFKSIMQEQFEVNRARRDAHRQMMEENGRSPELRAQMHEQRQLAQRETLDAVAVVLTPEQLARFEKMMEHRAEKGRRHRAERSRKMSDEDAI